MELFRKLSNLAGDLWYSLYPSLCIACFKEPKIRNGHFCTDCLLHMPYTDHFIIKENQVMQKFYGRVDIEFAAAVLYFTSSGPVRNMLHQLKYNRERAVGIIMGNIAGEHCLKSPFFSKPDFMVPIPLHPSKEYKRGYNQSYIFGEGIRQVVDIPLSKTILIKTTKTDSQTGKSRSERILNVRSGFHVAGNDDVRGKHILILDDVVTTGATVEAASMVLKEAGAKKISLLSIAVAQ